MSVTNDIARTYRAPRAVLRNRIAAGATEGRALAILMAGCLLMFVAQWPGLSRAAYADPSIPVEARIGGALMAWLFVMPLVFYIIAALTHVIARLFGGTASWLEARMALFWALLAAAPLWLLTGLVAGFVGQGPALIITASAAGVAFLIFWGAGLWEVERGSKARA